MAPAEANRAMTMPTILAHPAVAAYLAELDHELRGSSAPHADDLRDQVRAHIEDDLDPSATDADVAQTLARLGPPGDLIAEATPTRGSTDATTLRAGHVRPPWQRWIQRRSRRWWIAFVLLLVVAAATTTAWVIESDVARVQVSCETCGWYTAPDIAHNKFTVPDSPDVASDIQQWTVPLRVRQPQMFTFTVWNPSRLTQQLIGGSIPSGLTSEHLSLSFSTQDPLVTHGDTRSLSYRDRVSIPPHSSRVVRESWTRDCTNNIGGSETMELVTLRVRALGLTRHETFSLPAVFQTIGVPSRHPC